MNSTHLRWLCQNLDFLRVPLNATERAERQGNVPYWGANGVVDYVDEALVDEPVVLIGEDGAPFFERYHEVAFCTDGKIWPNNHIHILRPNRHIMYDRFLCYFLNHVDYAKYVNGSTRDKLTQAQLGSITINYPGLENQKAIADFLDRETARIDQLIEKREQQVALLGERKAAQASLFVTQGLNPYVTKVSTGISWLPEAPSHWCVRRIATIFHEVDERGNDVLPVLSVSINWGISDRELEDEDRHRIVNHIADKTSYKRVRIDDLVYNMMRAWQGAFGVATVDGLVSPAYVVARPNESIYSPYFEPLLRTPMCIEEFRRASKGIADFRQRLYWEHFRQVRVVLPPIEEQRAIAQRIQLETTAIDRVIVSIKASIDRLHELRSALITAAVTGQIDVTTWGKRGTTDRQLDTIEANMAAAAQPERQQVRA